MNAMRIEVTAEPFDPVEALRAFEAMSENMGAITSFLGKVRKEDAGDPVEALTLEHYPGLTEKTIRSAADEAMRRWRLGGLLVIHRVGRMVPGEPIVLVAAAAPHRRAAFEAADFLMDYLKTRALFWKKETRAGIESWIEPREEDYQDAARWDDGIEAG